MIAVTTRNANSQSTAVLRKGRRKTYQPRSCPNCGSSVPNEPPKRNRSHSRHCDDALIAGTMATAIETTSQTTRWRPATSSRYRTSRSSSGPTTDRNRGASRSAMTRLTHSSANSTSPVAADRVTLAEICRFHTEVRSSASNHR